MTSSRRFVQMPKGLSLAIIAATITACQTSSAATFVWNAAAPGANNWTDSANWNPNTGIPGIADSAIFGAVGTGPDAVTVNNIVNANTSVANLNYTNTTSGAWHVTQISAPNKLTVTNNFTVGGITADGIITSVAMTGDGTFEADGNAFKVGDAGSASTSALNAMLDMSALSNFVYNAPSGTWIVAGSGGDARGGGVLNLAGYSNNITVGTINFNTGSGNNSGFHSLLQLGAGTNIFNVGTFVVCQTKAQFATVQFINSAAPGAGLRIRGTNGNADDTSRGNITLGDRNNSGSANTDGEMLLNGHPVDIKANTILIGQDRSSSSTSTHQGIGVLQFDTGIVDATTINVGVCTSSGANASANGTLTVGAGGKLIVGSGGISLARRTGGTAATGTLNISGTVICSNNIAKTTNTAVANISITGGNVTMVSGVIGTPDAPIDNFTIASAILTFAVTNDLTNVVSTSFNPVDSANVANITAIPTIFTYPTQFPLIAYSSLAGGGSVSLGTLPGTFTGYISNDNSAMVWLVITNGPATAKVDLWSGAINSTWDTTTRNWTSGSTSATYNENDGVTFDDSASTSAVNFSTAHTPSSLTFNNNSLSYTLSGSGSITGATSLVKNGGATTTLSESGGDNFAGGITVNAGTLVLDNPNSAIGGSLAIAPGAIAQIGNNDANGNPPPGGLANDGTLNIMRTDNLVIPAAISGAGALNQNGSGVLFLAANNPYSGSTTVSAGTLALTNSGAISNSSSVTVNSAKLDLSGVSSGVTTLTSLTLNNSVLVLGSTNPTTPLNITTTMAMGGTGNTINVSALPTFASYPSTITLVQSAFGISGFNATLGTLPAASPAYSGSVHISPDTLSITLTLTSGPTGTRPFVSWSGADVPNLNTNWSDNQNWQLAGAPVAGDNVFFNNNGAQFASALSTPGGGINSLIPENIDNIVDANFTLSSLVFTNLTGSYHNTFIKSGNVLSVTNSGFNIGAFDTGASIQTTAVTVSGTNATLSVNNTNGNFQVWLGNSGTTGAQATLDLSALDNFSAIVSHVLIGANTNNAVNRPSGILYLARTNVLIAAFQTTNSDAGSTTANAAIDVADCNANAGSTSSLYLGLVNTISADTINIGRQKASGNLLFNPAYVNVAPYPTASFGGYSGSRVSSFEVGNGAGNTGTTTLAADADFTGGSVNASVDTLNIGRGSSGSGSGITTGTLNFDAGNINANTVNIGLQPASGSKVGIGSVGVSSNTVIGAAATLTVNNSINLGFAGGGSGAASTSGTLNITNGTVSANSIVVGTNSLSAINLIGGRLAVATTIGSASAPLGTLNLAPLNTPDNSNTVLQVPAALAPSIVVNNLTIDGLDSTTNRINISSVTSITPPAELPLIQYSTLSLTSGGTFNLGLGTLPAGYSGYFTNDTTLNQIAVVITSAPVVVQPNPPTIKNITISGGNIILSGTNNTGSGGNYRILTSTNIATPLTNWTVLTNGTFDGSGNFNVTNALGAAKPQSFYILQAP